MLLRAIKCGLLGAVILLTGTSQAKVTATVNERQSLQLTVYNSNLALIRDSRKVDLQQGEQELVFGGIATKIQPESAFLNGKGVEVLEQNYSFDLLSPESLLRKHLGKEIIIVRRKNDMDEEYRVKARVLSVAGGVVLQIDDQIETAIDGRIIFPEVPEGLHAKPYLTMMVNSSSSGEREVKLSYLTQGMTWRADYVAQLNKESNRLDLQGWVTLTNSSGTEYENARLQLVAGDVNRVQPERMVMLAAETRMAADSAKSAPMQRESLLAYHLYSVDRPTTVLQNQTKQISLLQENDAICRQQFVFRSPSPHYYWSRVGEIVKGVGVEVILRMKNDEASNLGLPKPAGTVRVYREDESGSYQFVGEDTVPHTPENKQMNIKLGRSFDITADRVQTEFTLSRGANNQQRIYESGYAITVHNAKAENTEVKIEENIPGDWQILSESQPHVKESAAKVSWKVKVNAKSSTELRYRVRQIME